MARRLARREFLRVGGLAGLGAALAACKPEVVVETVLKEVEKVVKETVVVEGEVQVVEKVITVMPETEEVEIAPQDVTLTVLTIWGGTRVPLMDDMIARFQEKYPWITVEHVLVPGGERLQKIQTGIAGGTPDDVVMVGQGEIPMFATRRALVPLDDYMQAYGVDPNAYYDTSFRLSQWQDVTYQLPNVLSTYHYFYNVDLFEEAGLDPDTPPDTWDDLITMSKELTTWDGGFIDHLGYSFYHGLPNRADFLQVLVSAGGEFYSEDAREAVFNSEVGVQSLEILLDAMDEIYGSVEDYQAWGAIQGSLDISNPFIAGTMASAHRGVWDIFYIESADTDLNYRVALLPRPAGGTSRFVGDVPGGGNWGYAIPAGAKSVEDSWRLVEWLCHEPMAAGWFMQQQGRPSPLKAVNEDPFYYEEFPHTWPDVVKALETYAYIPLSPASAEIGSVLTQALEEAALGVTGAKDALDWAAAESQALLDEAWGDIW